jgi:hypothetical protein
MRACIVAIYGAVEFAVGIGLLSRRSQMWARSVGIVIAGISLIGFPVGTAVGAYGLWVLLSRGTSILFNPFERT